MTGFEGPTARTRYGSVDLVPFQRRAAGRHARIHEWERQPAAIALDRLGWSPERIAAATGLRTEDVRAVLAGTYTEQRITTKPAGSSTAHQRLLYARRSAERVERGGRLVHPDAPHGTYRGYKQWLCRCWPCTDAKAAYAAEHRRRQNEEQPCQ